MARDYYRILGVKKGASEAEIKRAYRKLARELHPDVTNNDPASTERFKDVTQAWEVLSDPRRRRSYDLFGAPDSGGNAPPPTIDLDFVLDQVFPNRKKKPAPAAGVDVEKAVRVSLREALSGCTRRIEGQRGDVTVTIPAGVDDGVRLRVKGQGAAGVAGGPAGDLYVLVHVDEDPVFRRDGADLLVDVKAPLGAFLLGGRVEVPLPDGALTMAVPAGTQGGQVFRLRGKGLPRIGGGGTGDLLVTLQVRMPGVPAAARDDVVALLARLPDAS